MKISLAAARVNAELTQKQAAKKMGVNICTMIKWESGKTSPRAKQLVELCNLYGCTMGDIFLPNQCAKSEQN